MRAISLAYVAQVKHGNVTLISSLVRAVPRISDSFDISRLWLRSPPLVIRVQTRISAVTRIWRSRHALYATEARGRFLGM